ncbi:DUF6702 family protein [Winogradskyella alexanderae]|uniref:Peptidase E n=1 Tax=Winogradskyella alexanderae TaxID=2877123 RepID=A0ABS7XSN7_9FLAO|nr:DUF6702 family protein [Winogradskyella alexanderae]MCA0133033.1 peptidase E [Winogradskyella alexanderae]
MRRLNFFLLLFLVPFLISSGHKHEYYVSVTNIEYVQKEESVQIITQIFIDDFERMIRERFDERITLAIDNESILVDDYMTRYLTDKLEVTINNKSQKFNFLGKEYKEDIAYCYLEISDIKAISSIEVKNRVLFDIYPDQQNIVRLKINNKNKSYLLIPDNDNCVLNFN